MNALVATALILVASPAGTVSHGDEIRIFATTMAIAKAVKESCTGIAPDDRFLEALRLRLHVDEADRPGFTPIARAAADALRRARDEATSRQAWCDAVFRLYGPDGKSMQGLLRDRSRR